MVEYTVEAISTLEWPANATAITSQLRDSTGWSLPCWSYLTLFLVLIQMIRHIFLKHVRKYQEERTKNIHGLILSDNCLRHELPELIYLWIPDRMTPIYMIS